jgi:hypothetical protein
VAGSVQFSYDNAFRLQDILVNGSGISGMAYDRDGLPIANGYLAMSNRGDNGLLEFLGACEKLCSKVPRSSTSGAQGRPDLLGVDPGAVRLVAVSRCIKS